MKEPGQTETGDIIQSPQEFSPEEISAVKDEIALLNPDQVAQLILTTRRERESAREDSITDHLTGLYNRRHMDHLVNFFDHNLARDGSEKFGEFSVLFLDCDDFKNFNDTYGHEVGDAVLQLLGGVLKKSVRDGDIPTRYGGDEMVTLLVNCDEKGAKEISDRINRFLTEEMSNQPEGSPFIESPVKVTFGSATLGEGKTVAGLIKEANEHMHILKDQRGVKE